MDGFDCRFALRDLNRSDIRAYVTLSSLRIAKLLRRLSCDFLKNSAEVVGIGESYELSDVGHSHARLQQAFARVDADARHMFHHRGVILASKFSAELRFVGPGSSCDHFEI